MPTQGSRTLFRQVLSQPGPALRALTSQARAHTSLQNHIVAVLEPGLAVHVRVIGLHQGRLVLGTGSAAWATRLRYHTTEICRKFRAKGIPVSECRILVTPLQEPPAPPPPVPLRLSPEAALVIEGAAAGITHAPLAEALRRLAAHARRGD